MQITDQGTGLDGCNYYPRPSPPAKIICEAL